MSAIAESPRIKLLLVDDLPENLIALEALLRRDDLEILQARDGASALELLLAHDIALALIDVQMPGMDGFELAELIRGYTRTRQVPIILMTAGPRDQQRLFRGYDAGAVDFLFKPLEPQIVRNKVETFVQLYRQRWQLAQQVEALRQAQIEREGLVANLTETLRLNELFLAVLGHDLRNPLSAIIASADLVKRRSSETKVQTTADRILSAGRRMSGMINDMLDLARSRLGGGIPIKRASVDLAEVTQRVVEELRSVYPERSILSDVSGNVVGDWDGARLGQALSNLIGNALQHGHPESATRVVVEGTAPEKIVVSVTNGGEIPQARLPRLFDPFVAATERTNPSSGLGLGLYIVQQIALSHQGEVEIETSVGSTTIRLHLPRFAGIDAAAEGAVGRAR